MAFKYKFFAFFIVLVLLFCVICVIPVFAREEVQITYEDFVRSYCVLPYPIDFSDLTEHDVEYSVVFNFLGIETSLSRDQLIGSYVYDNDTLYISYYSNLGYPDLDDIYFLPVVYNNGNYYLSCQISFRSRYSTNLVCYTTDSDIIEYSLTPDSSDDLIILDNVQNVEFKLNSTLGYHDYTVNILYPYDPVLSTNYYYQFNRVLDLGSSGFAPDINDIVVGTHNYHEFYYDNYVLGLITDNPDSSLSGLREPFYNSLNDLWYAIAGSSSAVPFEFSITDDSFIYNTLSSAWLFKNTSVIIDDYSRGFASGYNAGYSDGRNYNDSIELGDNLLGSTLKAPIDALGDVYLISSGSIQISILDVINGVIGLALFIALLKVYAGG